LSNAVQIQPRHRDGQVGRASIAGRAVTIVVSDTNWLEAQKVTGGKTPEEVLTVLVRAAESGDLQVEPLKPQGELFLQVAGGACDLAGCVLRSVR